MGGFRVALVAALAALCSTCREEKAPEGTYRNSLGMEFVRIPPGEFLMGSTEADAKAVLAKYPDAKEISIADERPAHPVRLTQALLMGKHEVTAAQFHKFVAATGYKTDAEERDGAWVLEPAPEGLKSTLKGDAGWQKPYLEQTGAHPVVCVSWYDADKFAEWLTKADKKRPKGWAYRLPTEAEWEFAARGPKNLVYPWGDAWDPTRCNFAAKRTGLPWDDKETDDGFPRTSPVEAFSPRGDSPLGIAGMADNVGEWCHDWFGPYAQGSQADPAGPPRGAERVVRGGCWGNDPRNLRCAVRGSPRPFQRYNMIGIRVVLAPASD